MLDGADLFDSGADSQAQRRLGPGASRLHQEFEHRQFSVHKADLLLEEIFAESRRLEERDHEITAITIWNHPRRNRPAGVRCMEIVVEYSSRKIGPDPEPGLTNRRLHVPPFAPGWLDGLDIFNGPLRPVRRVAEKLKDLGDRRVDRNRFRHRIQNHTVLLLDSAHVGGMVQGLGVACETRARCVVERDPAVPPASHRLAASAHQGTAHAQGQAQQRQRSRPQLPSEMLCRSSGFLVWWERTCIACGQAIRNTQQALKITLEASQWVQKHYLYQRPWKQPLLRKISCGARAIQRTDGQCGARPLSTLSTLLLFYSIVRDARTRTTRNLLCSKKT